MKDFMLIRNNTTPRYAASGGYSGAAEVGENKMGTMPMFPLIINMSLPMMLSMLVQSLYNVVDSVFVARLGEEALTAVSLAFPVQSLMLAFAISSAVGVNALLSTRLGEKKADEVSAAAMNGLFIAVCLTVLFILLGVFFVHPYFATQTKDAVILKYGTDYLDVILLGGFGCFGVVMLERLLQSTGKTFYSMIAQISGAVTNIILDPIMIFGLFGFPRMETAGAALATIIGQFVGIVVSACFNLRKNREIHFTLHRFKPSLRVIAQVYRVGLPTLLLNALMPVTTYLMNRILGAFSMTAVAVYGVYFKLNSFVFMPVFGLNNGLVPIIAYNYGARRRGRVISAIKIGVAISIVVMAAGTALFEVFPAWLLSLFAATPNMLSIGVSAMRTIALSFVLAAVGITFDSAFQALNAAMYAAIHAILRQIVVLLPSAYLLSRLGDVNKVWYAFIIAEVVSFACACAFMRRANRRRIQKI